MARVTVEDCLEKVPNRFALTVLAARRARALADGRGEPIIECDNKEGVTALREVSAEKIRYKEDVPEEMRLYIEEQRNQLQLTQTEKTFLEAAALKAIVDGDDDEDEDEGDDVDELPSDPEMMNRAAAKTKDADDDDDDDGDSDSDEDEDGDDDDDTSADFDAAEVVDGDDDSDDDDDDDE